MPRHQAKEQAMKIFLIASAVALSAGATTSTGTTTALAQYYPDDPPGFAWQRRSEIEDLSQDTNGLDFYGNYPTVTDRADYYANAYAYAPFGAGRVIGPNRPIARRAIRQPRQR